MTAGIDKPSQSRPVETTEGAMEMAKLRELRLAAEAKAAGETKAKRKAAPSGKGTRS